MANLLKMHLMQLLLIKWHIQMIYLDLKTMCNANLKLGVNGKVIMLTMKTIWNIGKNSCVDCLNLGKTNYQAKTNLKTVIMRFWTLFAIKSKKKTKSKHFRKHNELILVVKTMTMNIII